MRARYDCANVGFLISHLNDAEMESLFGILKNALVPDGAFVITDSVWSDFYQSMGMKKTGMAERSLFDGKKFRIYKCFFENKELYDLGIRYGFEVDIKFWGEVFFLAAGRFVR